MGKKIKEFYKEHEGQILGAALLAATAFAFYNIGDVHGRLAMFNEILEQNDIKAKI